QYVRELPHCSFSTLGDVEKTNAAVVCCREQQETFLNARSPSRQRRDGFLFPVQSARRLSRHRAVDDVLHLLAIILAQLARRGRSHHHDEPLLRIAEELRAVSAIPGEFAGI